MAYKDVWDAKTLRRELDQAYNGLDSIPNRHVKKLKRAVELLIYMERQTVIDRAAGEVTPDAVNDVVQRSHGYISALSQLHGALTAVLDGSFERVGLDSDEDSVNYDAQQAYEDLFEGDDLDE